MSKAAMQFELVLVETIQELLISGDDAWIPGLGTFQVNHMPAQIRHDESRNVLVVDPPHSRISFSPSEDDADLPTFTAR